MYVHAVSKACAVGALGVIKLLMAAGADVNAVSPSGTTPMHTACRSNQGAVVELLLNEGRALLNVADKTGKTPLHIAAEFGHEVLLGE